MTLPEDPMTDNTPEGMRAALASLFASKATYSGDEVIRRILDPALAAPYPAPAATRRCA